MGETLQAMVLRLSVKCGLTWVMALLLFFFSFEWLVEELVSFSFFPLFRLRDLDGSTYLPATLTLGSHDLAIVVADVRVPDAAAALRSV